MLKFYMKHSLQLLAFLLVSARAVAGGGEVTIVDGRHYSQVFAETRNYRVFLPPGYSRSSRRYPVIYFFHGWSQRYFGSSNPYGDFDKGEDNGGDNIANFVGDHEVIIVKADGYNRSPGEVYYVRPYNVTPVETYRQFPIYFPELVDHIDAHYRTIADREHRGIAGLSMGGFMSFWIGGKYPHLLSAAGNFCGSAEFEVGPKDFPVEYRHLDMYNNYGGMNVRLHYGDKDFIRGYHEDLNKVWPQTLDNYSYKVFDAGHSTCGMGEMLGFILQTFDSPPEKPARWHHTDVYPEFSVWDYTVTTDRIIPGFTILENVDRRGFRISVREFLPDGSLIPSVNVTVRTAPLYEKNQSYVINDIDTRTAASSQRVLRSDNTGRLVIDLDGNSHEIGINKKNDKPNIVVTSFGIQSGRWATAGQEVTIALKIVNKGLSAVNGLQVAATTAESTTSAAAKSIAVGSLDANQSKEISVSFQSRNDSIEMEKLKVAFSDGRKNEWTSYLDIPMRKKYPELNDFVLADGKVFRVAKSGIDSETVSLGHGNGDGIANPGESIVVLVRDQGKLWRTELIGKDDYVDPYGTRVRRSDSWSSFDHVGASAKYDVPLIASDCPEQHRIEFLAEYWLPAYPLHVIKRGVVRFEVAGEDTTSPAIGRIYVSGDNILNVHLRDGAKITKASAKLVDEKDPEKFVTTRLTDDGQGGDRVGSDLVFSQKIPDQGFGIFRVIVEAEDSFGNRTIHEAPERYVFH